MQISMDLTGFNPSLGQDWMLRYIGISPDTGYITDIIPPQTTTNIQQLLLAELLFFVYPVWHGLIICS
jgi:putative NADPH-quinone reductase